MRMHGDMEWAGLGMAVKGRYLSLDALILPFLITRSTRNIEAHLDNRMSMQTTLQKVSQGLPGGSR